MKKSPSFWLGDFRMQTISNQAHSQALSGLVSSIHYIMNVFERGQHVE
jgi:hypothetical protein